MPGSPPTRSDGARHQAAAADPVEFRHAGDPPGRRRVLRVFRSFKGECAAFARGASRAAAMGGAAALLEMVFQPPQASHLPCQRS